MGLTVAESPSGLIGRTGFVGANLLRALTIESGFDSTNIATIDGRRFHTLICAAPHARKWWANLHPEEDRSIVESLIGHLRTTAAERFILISTVDVFPRLTGVDETFAGPYEGQHPYGRHRLRLETAVREHFAVVHVVRLPGLFGPGLKKNAIYDLLHHHELEKLNPISTIQWYDVRRLAGDLERIVRNGLALSVLATEPIETAAIVEAFFPGVRIGGAAGPVVEYDVRTVHANHFGGRDGWILGRDDVFDDLRAFVADSAPVR